MNELKHKILSDKNNKEIKKKDKCEKAIIKNNKIYPNRKLNNNNNNNLVAISLINNNINYINRKNC